MPRPTPDATATPAAARIVPRTGLLVAATLLCLTAVGMGSTQTSFRSTASPILDRTAPGVPAQPCEGLDCRPDPEPNPANPGPGPGTTTPGTPGTVDQEASCGFTDIGCHVTNAINGFFRGIVTAALNPLLDLLSITLLTTPTPADLPALAGLWAGSWQILLTTYSLLVIVAGVVVMSCETLQTRYTLKEVGPRIVAGFLVSALSLWAATGAIEITNSVSEAVLQSSEGGGLDAASAGDALREITLTSLDGGIFVLLLGLFLAGLLLAVLLGWVIRVAVSVILIAGAPIALMFHALPQTEHIAYWWWKAFGGCLAIQVVQSLALVTALRVFLTPGGFALFGVTDDGLVNLLVACALLYVLFKIPFWVLTSMRGNRGRRSLVSSLIRGFIAYKTFGLLSGRGHRAGTRAGRAGRGRGAHLVGGAGNAGTPDPYERARATADGQYVLPLPGLRRSPVNRTRPTAEPGGTPASRRRRTRQLALPLGQGWPEDRPVLGRDGQYRLPIRATRSTVRAPAAQGPAAPAGPAPRRRGQGVQLELPFDPYRSNRPNRAGQYPLPLDGVRRVPRPAPRAAPASATSGAREPSSAGQQLRLPLGLPRPTRTPPTPPTSLRRRGARPTAPLPDTPSPSVRRAAPPSANPGPRRTRPEPSPPDPDAAPGPPPRRPTRTQPPRPRHDPGGTP